MFQFVSHHQICLLLVLVSNTLAQIMGIDPRAPDAASKVYYHCLYSKKRLQIKDPFNPSEIKSPKFIAMDWYKTRGGKEEILMTVGKKSRKVIHPDISIFEYWGIQINNISMDTEGNYTAKLIRLSPNEQVSLQIRIAVPPVLTQKLTFRRDMKDDSVTVYCGPIVSLGDPAVNIDFKDYSGEVVNTSNKLDRGFVHVTYTDGPPVDICEVNWTSPGAKCISNKSQWKADGFEKSNGAHPLACLWTELFVFVTGVVQVCC